MNLAVITLHNTAHARALVFEERRRLSPLVPTAIGRVLVRVRVRPYHWPQKEKHQKHERLSTNTPQRNLAVIALHHTAHARALVFGERYRLSSSFPKSYLESMSSSSSS